MNNQIKTAIGLLVSIFLIAVILNLAGCFDRKQAVDLDDEIDRVSLLIELTDQNGQKIDALQEEFNKLYTIVGTSEEAIDSLTRERQLTMDRIIRNLKRTQLKLSQLENSIKEVAAKRDRLAAEARKFKDQ